MVPVGTSIGFESALFNQIDVLPLPPGVVDQDPSGHPTLEGTHTILNAMEEYLVEQSGTHFILNEKFCVNPRYYVGVQPIFKYGCKNCDVFGQYPTTGGLCPSCFDEYDPSKFISGMQECREEALKYERDFEEDYPRLPGSGGPPVDDGASETSSVSTVVNEETPTPVEPLEDGEIVDKVESEVHVTLPEGIAESVVADSTVPPEAALPPASAPPPKPKRSLQCDAIDDEKDISAKVIKTDLHIDGSSMSDN